MTNYMRSQGITLGNKKKKKESIDTNLDSVKRNRAYKTM